METSIATGFPRRVNSMGVPASASWTMLGRCSRASAIEYCLIMIHLMLYMIMYSIACAEFSRLN